MAVIENQDTLIIFDTNSNMLKELDIAEWFSFDTTPIWTEDQYITFLSFSGEDSVTINIETGEVEDRPLEMFEPDSSLMPIIGSMALSIDMGDFLLEKEENMANSRLITIDAETGEKHYLTHQDYLLETFWLLP